MTECLSGVRRSRGRGEEGAGVALYWRSGTEGGVLLAWGAGRWGRSCPLAGDLVDRGWAALSWGSDRGVKFALTKGSGREGKRSPLPGRWTHMTPFHGSYYHYNDLTGNQNYLCNHSVFILIPVRSNRKFYI